MMDDLISRQAAIREIVRVSAEKELNVEAIGTCIHILTHLPAQPEIIRCKDCKYSEHWYRDKARCFLWHEEGIGVFENGFCNYEEKRAKREKS